MKKTKIEKKNKELRDVLFDLIQVAERVSNKYGVNEDGTPSDWTEWVDLRRVIQNAKGT